jgi:uncharacterized damage-inducible protein DinB
MKMLFMDLAEANRHINRTWLDGMAHLALAELDRPQGAFFGSIFGTWNHILVGDRIWMARILNQPAPTDNLRERLCATMESFRPAREETDDGLIRLVAGMTDFAQDLVYRNTKGTRFQTPLYQVLAHLFAHQSHHRGQISQMFHERKIPVPDGGLIDFFRNRPR